MAWPAPERNGEGTPWICDRSRREARHKAESTGFCCRWFDRWPHFAIGGASDGRAEVRNGIMRWLVILAGLVLAQLAHSPASAASCTREDFALAVDRAGAALRKLNADNLPRLRAKMSELKVARGWPDAGFEEKAYEVLQDERMAALDAQANDLLAKLDALGTVEPSSEPDCAKLQELTASSLELQATVKAKAAYTLAKLDQMLGGASCGPGGGAQEGAQEPRPPRRPRRPPPPLPKAPARPPQEPGWETRTKGEPSREVAIAPPPPPPAQSCRRLRRPVSRRVRRRRATPSTRSWRRARDSSARSRPISAPSSSTSSRTAAAPPATSWAPKAAGRSSPACATAAAPSTCAPPARRRRRSIGTGPRSAPISAPPAPRRCS